MYSELKVKAIIFLCVDSSCLNLKNHMNQVWMYVKSNKRLNLKNQPLSFIWYKGTGVAPFRSFIQERSTAPSSSELFIVHSMILWIYKKSWGMNKLVWCFFQETSFSLDVGIGTRISSVRRSGSLQLTRAT